MFLNGILNHKSSNNSRLNRKKTGKALEIRHTAMLRLLFGVTILSSAFLLFLVQPLASKLILPWFGGSGAVWITCMLFFQTGLLLGYCYAHWIARRFAGKQQALFHTVLLLLSLAALPILPNAIWKPAPSEDPTWRVLGVLATSAGLPYVMLSATTPLLQSWYARTDRSGVPYRYFALSNAGSLVALLGYPIAVEPYFTGRQQAWMWSIAFALFASLCIGTALVVRRGQADYKVAAGELKLTDSPRVALITLWLSLAGCASTLLLVTTNLLTQNIAPMPLLWVLPLSIYLLTFILCFESDRWYKRSIFLPLVLPALGYLATASSSTTSEAIALEVPILCAALFICCMTCHGELARLKPVPHQLTAFYLSLSAGGALGGLFVAVLAPHFFSAMYEYPISFVSCAALLLVVLSRERHGWIKPKITRPLWLAALAGTVVLSGYVFHDTRRNIRFATLLRRNFYGALRVDDFMDNGNKIRELSHGTITHGIEFRDSSLRRQPTTYYSRDSGIGLTWRVLESKGSLRMGVVGLGAGTLAAYGRPSDMLRFYDINPLVVQIAKNQFTFLSDCPAKVALVLGDARLSLSSEPSQQFDILVIDAFSGDAIPVHLLTREAFEIYWRHLKPNGVLAVHVSNHYLKLAPIVMLSAMEFKKQAWQVENDDGDADEVYDSSYVLVTGRRNFFEDPLFKGQLLRINVPPHLKSWTDDFSNLWQVLILKKGARN